MLALCASGCTAPGEPPDVLLVVVDTLRADHLGAYGFPLPASPHFDRFAEGAVVFERAVAASSFTVPSHASLMTSRYVREHSVGWINGATRLERAPTLAQRFHDGGYETAAFVSNFVLRRAVGLGAGFDLYDDDLRDAEANRPFFYERTAEATTERALAWLSGRGAAPVFVFVHYQDPHGPYTPPPGWDEPFAPLESGVSQRLPVLGGDARSGGIPPYQALPGLDRVAQYRRRYAGEIAYFDDSLERLLAAFVARERPLVVAFTADHGESFGEGGYYFSHGHATTPELAHVPFVIRAPGVEPGRRAEAVHHVDIAPTLLELAGLPALEDARGIALGPYLRSRKPIPGRMLFCDVGFEASGYVGGAFVRGRRIGNSGLSEFTEFRWSGGQRWESKPVRDENRRALEEYLKRRTELTRIPDPLSPADRERLRALGYVDGD
jgi:arylsulfatase